MKMLSFVAVLLISGSVYAQDSQPRHMVMFGNDFSTSWSGSATTADVDSSLGVKDYITSNGNFKLNYAYRLTSRFQLGIDFANEMDTSEVKVNAGGKIKSEEFSTGLTIFGIVNFSDEINDSFYLGAGVGQIWFKSTQKDTTGGTVDSSKSEYDAKMFTLMFGKRFHLKSLGIENLTYSPSISYQHATLSGDLEDNGVNSLTGVTLDIVKFDLLF